MTHNHAQIHTLISFNKCFIYRWLCVCKRCGSFDLTTDLKQTIIWGHAFIIYTHRLIPVHYLFSSVYLSCFSALWVFNLWFCFSQGFISQRSELYNLWDPDEIHPKLNFWSACMSSQIKCSVSLISWRDDVISNTFFIQVAQNIRQSTSLLSPVTSTISVVVIGNYFPIWHTAKDLGSCFSNILQINKPLKRQPDHRETWCPMLHLLFTFGLLNLESCLQDKQRYLLCRCTEDRSTHFTRTEHLTHWPLLL